MGYGSRKPTSNDLPRSTGRSPWLVFRNDIEDEFFLRISGRAKDCAGCMRATSVEHLDDDGRCPDCRG